MPKVVVHCDYCGAEIERYPSTVFAHNFCSKQCQYAYSSKKTNPDGYAGYMDHSKASARMSALNRALNKTRMAPEVREKIRQAQLGRGAGVSYEKNHGRHTHRVMAEEMLGRPLLPGEVVHHIDGDIRNNAPENLMVFASQAEHARHHAEQRRRNERKEK